MSSKPECRGSHEADDETLRPRTFHLPMSLMLAFDEDAIASQVRHSAALYKGSRSLQFLASTVNATSDNHHARSSL